MPYTTSLDSSFATVSATGQVAFVPNTSLLNAFGPSQDFALYDVAGTSATSLNAGDQMTLVDAEGHVMSSGTYLGGATVMNAATSVTLPGISAISLQVNPIQGYLYEASDGTAHFISNAPLDDAHLAVTASIRIGLATVTVTGPISGITEQLAAAVAASNPVLGPVAAATIRASGNLLQTTSNTAIVTLQQDSGASLNLSDNLVVPCFTSGTLIDTPRGPTPVEALQPGDLVWTRDHGAQALRWIGRVRLGAADLRTHRRLRPIRIRAGALGPGSPATDLLVSPQHRILVQSRIARRMFDTDEVLIAAKHLIQADGIEIADDVTEVEYVHFLCDQHEIVTANGAATESMYIGPMALKAVGAEAAEEILTLFPELRGPGEPWALARYEPSAHGCRKLVMRQQANGVSLVS